MGLDISHNAFQGSYSGFNLFRKAVASAIGGSFPPHDPILTDDNGVPLEPDHWFYDDEKASPETHPGLFCFLNHSDCDGEIDPGTAASLADEMEQLLPVIDQMDGTQTTLRGGAGAVARKLIKGCRLAAARNESLKFR